MGAKRFADCDKTNGLIYGSSLYDYFILIPFAF